MVICMEFFIFIRYNQVFTISFFDYHIYNLMQHICPFKITSTGEPLICFNKYFFNFFWFLNHLSANTKSKSYSVDLQVILFNSVHISTKILMSRISLEISFSTVPSYIPRICFLVSTKIKLGV